MVIEIDAYHIISVVVLVISVLSRIGLEGCCTGRCSIPNGKGAWNTSYLLFSCVYEIFLLGSQVVNVSLVNRAGHDLDQEPYRRSRGPEDGPARAQCSDL